MAVKTNQRFSVIFHPFCNDYFNQEFILSEANADVPPFFEKKVKTLQRN